MASGRGVIGITLRETFVTGPLNLLSGIGDMVLTEQGGNLMLYAATRAGGGVIACDVDGAITLVDQVTFSITSQLPVQPTLDVINIGSNRNLVVSGSNQTTLLTYRLDALGTIGGISKPAGGPAGVISAQSVMSVGGNTYLYASMSGDGSVLTYQMAANGAMTLLQDLALTADLQAVNISELVEVRCGNAVFLAATLPITDRVALMQVGADGRLTQTASIGAAEGLGINGPAGLKVLGIHGQTFLLVAGGASSSLSVIEVRDDGSLRVADHVVDTLDTRIQGVTALEVASFSGRGFVIAGGGDNGLNLFEVLPDGRLVLLATLLDTDQMSLEAISAITLRETATGLDVFVAGEGLGITRLTTDLSTLATPLIGSAAAEHLTGGAGGDLQFGDAGNDTLAGGAGNDVLVDGTGEDVLSGGAGADLFVLYADGVTDRILDFQPGIDRLDLSNWGRLYDISALTIQSTSNGAIITYGNERLEIVSSNNLPLQASAFHAAGMFAVWHATSVLQTGSNIFSGTSQSEYIEGTAGADTIVASGGNDTLDGSGGFDTVDFTNMAAGVAVNLEAGIGAGTQVGALVLVSIEALRGSAHADTLTGSAVANLLEGNDGADLLMGRGGADTLEGGSGDDTLNGGAGADVLNGGEGVDLVHYWDHGTGLRIDMASTWGTTGDAAGDVFLDIEQLAGSLHDDVILGNADANTLIGLSGNDVLIGRDGNDTLRGDDGNDTFSGGGGADAFYGGNGFDLVYYWDCAQGVRADMQYAAGTTGEAAEDRFFDIEMVAGSNHADQLFGDAAANRLSGLGGDDLLMGRGGNDILEGNDGNDTFFGGAGADVFYGGAGNDLVAYWDSQAGLRIDMLLAYTGTGEAAGDQFAQIEAVAGSDFADTILGTHSADRLTGLAGDDNLLGRGGADVLIGDAGNDMLCGGAGADLLYGGDGFDLAYYWDAAVGVRADLLSPVGTTGDAAGDLFSGIEALAGTLQADWLLGDHGGNLLNGLSGDDRLTGRGGDDTLLGEAGNDSISGGAGADLIYGGAGVDLVFYWDAIAGVRADLLTPAGSAGDAAGDLFSGIENMAGSFFSDELRGDNAANMLSGIDGDDFLAGRGGDDFLNGGAGNDTLSGDEGNDVLVGGLGADSFIFSAGMDSIMDFDAAHDLIILQAEAWGGGPQSIDDILQTAVVAAHLNTVYLVMDATTRLAIVGISDVEALRDCLIIS